MRHIPNYALMVRLALMKANSRKEELDKCKTQKEKDVLLDRWSREDSAEKIADAIRSTRRRGLFF